MPKGVHFKVVHSLQFESMYIDVKGCLHPIEPKCGREFPQGLIAALLWQPLWGVCELVESCHILQTNVTNYSETFVPVYPIRSCNRDSITSQSKSFFHLHGIVQTEPDVHTTAYSKAAEDFFVPP